MDEKETRAIVEKQLPYAVDSVVIPELGAPKKGKVRDVYQLPGSKLMVTTDRLSAFDYVLCTIPYKGGVLNGISGSWFKATKDVAPNALQDMIGTMGMIMVDVNVLPYEAIVRAYITGSAARDYFDRGIKTKCGIDLSKYLREGKRNERFTELLFTPSTKSESGHDVDISEDKIPEEYRDKIKNMSFGVFKFGEETSRKRGLILVDTKFENGIDKDGNILLVDEVLTPESSRYWIAATYAERYSRGEEPEGLSKEPFRQEIIFRIARKLGMETKDVGNLLDKLPREVFLSVIDDELRIDTAIKYLKLYEQIIGEELELKIGDPREDIYHDLVKSGRIKGYFVPIIAGSPSDEEHVSKIKKELEKRDIPYEHRICSAHKDPKRLVDGVMKDYEESIEPIVYVTVAGMSNGLSGTSAANSRWPIIACPPLSGDYAMADIWPTLRTPSGTPAMTVLEPANVGAAIQSMFGLFDTKLRLSSVSERDSNRKKGADADEKVKRK